MADATEFDVMARKIELTSKKISGSLFFEVI